MGLLWGTLPVGVSVLALFVVLLLPSKQRPRRVVESPLAIEERESHYVA